MKKILITAGGTREYIDDVRVLTNISSGKLGATIAEAFLDYAEVYYVHAKDATLPKASTIMWGDTIHFYPITDVTSLAAVMQELVPHMDVVIHCMAVSDFGFEPCATKLKSSDPEAFIDSLRSRIKKNPKILPLIKSWNPTCQLVSFKFEVGLPHQELKVLAVESMRGAQGDLVIANDKTEMTLHQKHIAYALEMVTKNIGHPDDPCTMLQETRLESKVEIAAFLRDKYL